MSADNWAICPRCIKRARQRHDAEVATVVATYGKVPVEDFDAARAAIADVKPEDFRTFREDYEFYGAESGEVVAAYSGHCEECGLGLDFEARRTLDV